MSFQLLWYMLAAFILGFALSTLWEWFYFRARRLKWRDERVEELAAALDARQREIARYRAENRSIVAPATYATVDATEYQSSAARLDSEQHGPTGAVAPKPVQEMFRPDAEVIPKDTPAADGPIGADTLGGSSALVVRDTALHAAVPSLEPENHVPLSSHFVAPTDAPRLRPPYSDREDHVEAQPEQPSKPPRTVTATPQTHEELSQLIARLENLERQSAARMDRADMLEYKVDDESIVATASRVEGQPSHEESSQPGRAAEPDQTPSRQSIPPSLPVDEKSKSSQPSTRTAAAQHNLRTDNLQEIKGIGRTYEQRLQEGGIVTWRQIAESDQRILRAITRARANTDVANWQSQAIELMRQHGQQRTTADGHADGDSAASLGDEQTDQQT